MDPIKENIIKDLELDKLSEKEKEDRLIQVGDIIYQNVLMRVIETMSDKDQDEFEKILDNDGKPEDIFTFLNNKVPNFEQIINEEAIKFKNKTSDIMGQIGN